MADSPDRPAVEIDHEHIYFPYFARDVVEHFGQEVNGDRSSFLLVVNRGLTQVASSPSPRVFHCDKKLSDFVIRYSTGKGAWRWTPDKTPVEFDALERNLFAEADVVATLWCPIKDERGQVLGLLVSVRVRVGSDTVKSPFSSKKAIVADDYRRICGGPCRRAKARMSSTLARWNLT